jgi:hypothetical protein
MTGRGAYGPIRSLQQSRFRKDGSSILVDHQRRIRPWSKVDESGFVVLLVRSGLKVLEIETAFKFRT